MNQVENPFGASATATADGNQQQFLAVPMFGVSGQQAQIVESPQFLGNK